MFKIISRINAKVPTFHFFLSRKITEGVKFLTFSFEKIKKLFVKLSHLIALHI